MPADTVNLVFSLLRRVWVGVCQVHSVALHWPQSCALLAMVHDGFRVRGRAACVQLLQFHNPGGDWVRGSLVLRVGFRMNTQMNPHARRAKAGTCCVVAAFTVCVHTG